MAFEALFSSRLSRLPVEAVSKKQRSIGLRFTFGAAADTSEASKGSEATVFLAFGGMMAL